jgi:C4-dicarboxylate transporter DctQ subunit
MGSLFEGPTTPDLEMPTWIVYCAVPVGSALMCFRFLQVLVGFVRTGELPHHDHGHVEGIQAEPLTAAGNEDKVFRLDDDLHPLVDDADAKRRDTGADKGDRA